MVLLIVTVKLENSRRDRLHGVALDGSVSAEAVENELTDGKNANFRYML